MEEEPTNLAQDSENQPPKEETLPSVIGEEDGKESSQLPQHVLSVKISKDIPLDDQNNESANEAASQQQVTESTEETLNNSKKRESSSYSKGSSHSSVKPPAKKPRKAIFISYSPDGGFIERRFVCEVVRQFKENNLAEDIWFDKDEQNLNSATWFSQRMEMAEKCRAALCILTQSYFHCPVSVYELRILAERQKSHNPPKVFTVLLEETDLPKQFYPLMDDGVNLAIPAFHRLSLSEKASIVIGSLIAKVEPYATVNAPYIPPAREDDFTDQYKKRNLCRWTVNDLQSWLFDLGIREFYRQSFAEAFMDGFLLMSVMDQDMAEHLSVDSRVVRKKLLQQIVSILEKEQKHSESWHLRARTQRPKPDSVYIIYDPADVRLSQNLKQDLKRKNLLVLSHEKLGQSRDEFLQLNGSHIATCKNVVVLLTEAASSSPFVFHEVLFADWLGKSVVCLMFKNVWPKLRPALKAILGESMAIDFESKMYSESIDILEHHIKPLKKVPGVVLEQSYLNRMTEGLRPLQLLTSISGSAWYGGSDFVQPRVYISYQWDAQNKVAEIRRMLESHAIPCFADSSSTISQAQRGNSSGSLRGGNTHPNNQSAVPSEGLQVHLQRNMKSSAIVVCCITPRYLQSENCLKDIIFAESMGKPIVPVLLRFVAWPPDVGPSSVKKILARTTTVDFSNDKLYKQNFHLLLDKLRKYLSGRK